jgi:hypothetical protein
MPADINRRMNRILVGLSQNETLMEDMDADAASALLDWAGALAREIVSETFELDNEDAADEAMYPRLRALRQMIKQVNRLASGQPTLPNQAAGAIFSPSTPNLEPATALDQFINLAATVFGAQFVPPGAESRQAFLRTPPANTADWITALRTWLENAHPIP